MNDQNILLIERRKQVATVVFNRPDVRNAMSPELRDRFLEALDELEVDDSIRVVVLRGAEGNFIAGGDLAAFMKTLELDRSARHDNFLQRLKPSSKLIVRLSEFPKPLVSVIDGGVAGAGISIMLCTDFILATSRSKFSFAHVHVGLALDLGLSHLLPQAVGIMQAKKIAMLGQTIKAKEASEIGLVTSMIEHENLNLELDMLLENLSRLPYPAVTAIKKEFLLANASTFREQLDHEAKAVAECAITEEFEKRVSAFAEKPERAGRVAASQSVEREIEPNSNEASQPSNGLKKNTS